MKTLKMLALVVAFTFSGVVLANTNPNKEVKPNSINTTVAKLLKSPNFQLDKDVKTMAYIYVNDKNEMVVLSVDTDNDVVEDYVKGRLNYKKLAKDAQNKGKVYKLPIKIQKSK